MLKSVTVTVIILIYKIINNSNINRISIYEYNNNWSSKIFDINQNQ